MVVAIGIILVLLVLAGLWFVFSISEEQSRIEEERDADDSDMR